MTDGEAVQRETRLRSDWADHDDVVGELPRRQDEGVDGVEGVSSRTGAGRCSGSQAAIFALPALVLAAASWQHRLILEDGFIYLRVAKQIASGHGPVFNPGERVEATTGALWTFMLALADVVTPFRLEWIAVGFGIGSSVAGLVMAMLGARRLWGNLTTPRLFLPFGALVFALTFPSYVFASTGLETGLAFGWLGLSLWVISGWACDPGQSLTMPRTVVLGLGWLIRPELVLFSVAFAIVILLMPGPSAPARWRVLVGMTALPVAYQIFRMGYYGSLVPNTAIAKDGGEFHWQRGWRYFRDFADPYYLWIAASGMLLGGYLPLVAAARKQTRVVAVATAFLFAGIASALYVIGVGGDHTHARLLLPAYFGICAPVAAIPLTRRHAAALVLVPWSAAAMFVLRPDQYDAKFPLANGIAMVPRSDYGKVTVDDWGWGKGGPAIGWYAGPHYYRYGNVIQMGQVAHPPLRSDVHLPLGAFYGIGISGYALGTNFRILDLEGLADPMTAHLISTLPVMTTFPGHAKPLPPPWIAARVTRRGSRPVPEDFPPFGPQLIAPVTGQKFEEQVAWARAALRCDAIARILDASRSPLTVGRFGSNVFHAFANTRTRIPADPRIAYRTFCGRGTPASVQRVRD